MTKFCTRPSRLLSGEPDALFAQDSGMYSFSQTVQNDISSPFTFDLEGDACPSTVQWHGSKMSLSFFNAENGLSGIENAKEHIHMFLSPPAATGVAPFTPPLVFNNNAVAFEIRKTSTKQIDEFPAGFYKVFFEGSIEVPPQWNFKIVIVDGDAGVNFIRAGTIVTFSMLRSIIPVKFAEQS